MFYRHLPGPLGVIVASDGYMTIQTDTCTCYGGDQYHGHEPHCGLEPAGNYMTDFHPAILWDFTQAGAAS
ncbi:hypothetical protein [Nocardia flavorosea]|uniref:Uncharacterized protein n=1 Tax=Nocardia flavorosea TaxID=53429 RepID=A0A846YNR8_9NOCA|nr:hypothetical protein [Nocardia flavorosea]NKY60423.1 hypothetical protein [Nocardia flavorosea]